MRKMAFAALAAASSLSSAADWRPAGKTGLNIHLSTKYLDVTKYRVVKMATAYPSENLVISSELYETATGDFIVGCLVVKLQGQAFSSYVLEYNESSIFINNNSDFQKSNYAYLSNKNNLNDLSYGMFNACYDQIDPQYAKTTIVYIPTDNPDFILPGLFNDVTVNMQKIFGNGVKTTPTFTKLK